jgi:hypothetical protein
MTEVLKTDFSSTVEEISGQHTVEMEAVLLEPVFTYLVVGFLMAVSISGIAMLFISISQKTRIELPNNPGTTSSAKLMDTKCVCRCYCCSHVFSRRQHGAAFQL